MKYSYEEVLDYVEQEDVKFIRLAFCDIYGKQKNISIMPGELKKAFTSGISFDSSAIYGLGHESASDLFLFPNPETLNVLPWRPSRGKVVRMFCNIRYPDGRLFEKDTRMILENAIKAAEDMGLSVSFGTEFEFYLFKTDENGDPTDEPFDHAGYMDVAPEDKGENIRREICLTMEEMGIHPEKSQHKDGPGQNEIDFRYADAMNAADNAMNFISVVKAAALHNGLYADFSPKPIADKGGNGLHINISVESRDGRDLNACFMAGIMEHIREMTAFLNPCEDSYKRLGEHTAPKYVTWTHENRSQLIRIPSDKENKRFELRSADACANPYLAFALLIYAGLDGIRNDLSLPEPTNINLYTADRSVTDVLKKLPETYAEAVTAAKNSSFIRENLPADILESM